MIRQAIFTRSTQSVAKRLSPNRSLVVAPMSTVSAAVSPSWAASTAQSPPNGEASSSSSPWRLLAGGILASMTAASFSKHDISITKCEEEQEEEEEVDPYDNLPEEDEPTHCSICKTYRQGPCRPYWRKVEACTKDNELSGGGDDNKKEESKEKTDDEKEEEKTDPPCLKYMMPWIDCATSYRNLYNWIEMDTNYTLGIADLEEEAGVSMCWAPGNEPVVDWTEWQTYVQEHDWKLPTKAARKQTKANATKQIPLWKTLDISNGDVETISVTALVSTEEMGIPENHLECAYAQDQNGQVIGFAYGQKSGSDRKEGEEEQPYVTLTIRLLPNKTTHVVLAASYLPPHDKESSSEEDPPKSRLYKSKPYSLKKMGKLEKKEGENPRKN